MYYRVTYNDKGFDIFTKKVLPIIYNYIKKDKITIEVVHKLDNIIYLDDYQAVISEELY